VIPSPTPYPRLPIPLGAPRCRTSQLEVSFNASSAATGHVLNDFELRNRSSVSCWVYGYVGFQFLDGRGRPLPESLGWSTDTFFGRFAPPSRIALPPGTKPLNTGQGLGHAFFNVEGDDFTCSPDQIRTTKSLEIWPPDEYLPIVISAGDAGGTGFVSCGNLTVHPLEVQPHPSFD